MYIPRLASAGVSLGLPRDLSRHLFPSPLSASPEAVASWQIQLHKRPVGALILKEPCLAQVGGLAIDFIRQISLSGGSDVYAWCLQVNAVEEPI